MAKNKVKVAKTVAEEKPKKKSKAPPPPKSESEDSSSESDEEPAKPVAVVANGKKATNGKQSVSQ